MSTTLTPDGPRRHQGQASRPTWASGDYAVIGTTLQIVGESLCEAVDVARRLDGARRGRRQRQRLARRRPPGLRRHRHRLRGGAPRPAPRAGPRPRACPSTTQVADAEDLPFDDASFDAVLSTFGVMFVPDPAAGRGRAAPGVPSRRSHRPRPTGRPRASSARCSRSSAPTCRRPPACRPRCSGAPRTASRSCSAPRRRRGHPRHFVFRYRVGRATSSTRSHATTARPQGVGCARRGRPESLPVAARRPGRRAATGTPPVRWPCRPSTSRSSPPATDLQGRPPHPVGGRWVGWAVPRPHPLRSAPCLDRRRRSSDRGCGSASSRRSPRSCRASHAGVGGQRRDRRDGAHRDGRRSPRLRPPDLQRAHRGAGRGRRGPRRRLLGPAGHARVPRRRTPSRIRLATYVLVLGYHHPLELAKRYGTLDRHRGRPPRAGPRRRHARARVRAARRAVRRPRRPGRRRPARAAGLARSTRASSTTARTTTTPT